MTDEKLELVQASDDLREALLEMFAEFAAGGYVRYLHALARENFAAYLERLRIQADPNHAESGDSPQQTYFLRRADGRMLGELHLRLVLTPALMDFGGHIGYAVRPSERNKGYATRGLALLLPVARAAGISRARITCDSDNRASARVIEKNGGVLENQGFSPGYDKLVNRYWIELGE